MDEKNQHKRPYEKPVLTKINLSTEETMAVGCKMPNTGSGPGNFGGCNLAPPLSGLCFSAKS